MKEKPESPIFEKHENIMAWSSFIKKMYEEEQDETKKYALYFALNVMEIKAYKEMNNTHDRVLGNLSERSNKLEKSYIKLLKKTTSLTVKVYGLLVLQAITIASLILMIVKL